MSNWISVKDRLPDDFVSVLGAMPDADPFPPVRECYKIGGENEFFCPALDERVSISHWMPMPEPPWGETDHEPTVDAQPVVRCKDCLYGDPAPKNGRYLEGVIVCTNPDLMRDGEPIPMWPNDFCSGGAKEGKDD